DSEIWNGFLPTLGTASANADVQDTGRTSNLVPTSAATILATEYPPLRFLVPGLIVDGLTLLAGRPKVGKSWLALDLSVAIAQGGQFLGREAVQAGVLYLGLEDSPGRIKKRLSDLRLTSAPSGLEFLFKLQRLDDRGAEELALWLADRQDVKLVVVDVLNR